MRVGQEDLRSPLQQSHEKVENTVAVAIGRGLRIGADDAGGGCPLPSPQATLDAPAVAREDNFSGTPIAVVRAGSVSDGYGGRR